MNKTKDFKSVEEYVDSQPKKTRAALIQLQKCIRRAAPDAMEILNYNIPAYTLVEGGKREQQVMMAGYKNHVALYLHPTVIEKFEDDLKPYKKGKGSVQFPLDKPLPEDLIIRMLSYRKKILNENI